MGQVSWVAEVTELIGLVTGMVWLWFLHLDYSASEDTLMYYSSEEWNWLQPCVSTHPSLASSPTCLEDPHPGCALPCANTAILQRHYKWSLCRNKGFSLFFLHPKEKSSLAMDESIHWKWGTGEVLRFRNNRAGLCYEFSGLVLISLV